MADKENKEDKVVATAPTIPQVSPVGTPATAGHEVVELTASGPQVKTTEVNTRKLKTAHKPLDETVPGGMIVARMPNGEQQVVNADGVPIHGKKFDAEKQEVVNG